MAIVAALTVAVGPVADAQDAPLTILHADSLTGYVTELGRGFEATHPGTQVQREAVGSLDAIRRVTDLHIPCDIVVTADWRLLTRPHPGLAPWVMIFAGNSIGLLYTDHSADADQITADNWYRLLQGKTVRFGHSDPRRDPAGYWTLVMWRLAESYYHEPGLAARLAAACPPSNIRPKSIDFIALLESGDLDYFFGYSSDARLGGLRFLALPAAINLGDLSRAAQYARAEVTIGTDAQARQIRGAPIAYGATLTTNPPNRVAAVEFLQMMAGAQGRAAATHNGLVVYAAALAVDPENQMPAALKAQCRPFNPR